jgi:hypothetical protein
MSERKLAHIERIEWIRPIEGADKIELCGVLGWQCVIAKKDNFKVGDYVIYCEIDSVMPDKPEFEFLRERKFRVKTIKLRGQISQGLVLPTYYLKGNINFWAEPAIGFFGEVGDDVTEALGIKKYLSPTELSELEAERRAIEIEKNRLKKFMMRYSLFRSLFKKPSKKFPYWVSKTDEERIQNLGDSFIQQHKNKLVFVTEKVDYQSATFTSKRLPMFPNFLGKIFTRMVFVVASRNLINTDKNSLYWRIAKKYDLEEICKQHPDGITIQGEQGDTNVQGNKYGISGPRLWVFNIIKNGYFFNHDEIRLWCAMRGLESVPYIGIYKMSEIGSTVQDFVEFSRGLSQINSSIPREGVVIRCVEKGQKLFSFKVINPDFLLKYDN